MAQWEHAVILLITQKRETMLSTQKELLDKYGAAGWELVSVTNFKQEKNSDYIAYLKRPKI